MKRASWWVVTLLAIPVALYGFSFLFFRERMFPPQLAESFHARPWGIYSHAFGGGIALIFGAFQFHRGILAKRRNAHRLMGKIYVGAAMLVGVSGLYMAWYAFGGPITQVGFAGLAIAVLTTTITAFTTIRRGNVASHRRWVIRSYALIFAAVTLRIQLPLLIMYFGAFTPAYQMVAWLSWVPNLFVAEAIVRWSNAGVLPVARLRTT